jgi:type II secretory pathway pseudopilin PulG
LIIKQRILSIMKRLSRMVGVTLLEIMLVLAVASLVIVMSIRYYQSAQNSVGTQNLQRALASMLAYGDSFGMTAGSYTDLTPAILWASLPTDAQGTSPNLKTAWGEAAIGVTATATSYSGTLTIALPATTCAQVKAFLNTIAAQRGGSADCSTSAVTWTIQLNSTQTP